MKITLIVFLSLAVVLSHAAKLNIILDKSPSNEHSVIFSVRTTEAVSVLPWGTPLEDRLRADLFQLVDAAGNECQWQGAVYRRGPFPVSAEHFLTLPAGYEFSTEFDLAELYDCHAAPNATYTVALRFPHYAFSQPGGDLVDLAIFDEQIQVRWSPQLADTPKRLSARFVERSAADDAEPPVSTMDYTFQNCNSDQQSIIRNSVPKAKSQSDNGACLPSSCTVTYPSTWLGAYNADNYNYVKGVLSRVSSRLANGQASYCNPAGCGSNVYAYVYPTQCCTVYLCGLFWSIPAERAETIVHEQSHFNINSPNGKGTQDYQYGRSGCVSLAKSNSYNACHNADNICYYAAGYKN